MIKYHSLREKQDTLDSMRAQVYIPKDPIHEPELKWQIDSNISYSIASLRDISKVEREIIEVNQAPLFATATANTEFKMHRYQETLTGTGKKAMLSICLDQPNGYVFVQKNKQMIKQVSLFLSSLIIVTMVLLQSKDRKSFH